MLISILLPFKNTGQYLTDCIESIVDQTEQHWELIAVDDHSDDKSFKIITAYAKNDHRIKVYRNNGNGVIDALRTAYHHAQGQLITRMDSDDIMTIDKLNILKQNLLTHGPGHIALGQVKYISDIGIGDGYQKYESWLNALILTGSCWNELYRECVIPSPNWMVYRSDFDKSGGFQSNIYPEDYDLAFRFYECGLQPIPCDKITLHWRDYPTRSSRTSEHYRDNRFFDLKVHYFLKLHHDPHRPLCLLGAGKKGKLIARLITNQHIDFQWKTNNPNKVGHEIYNIKLQSDQYLESDHQHMVAISNPKEKEYVVNRMERLKMIAMKDYFLFC
jgi:glycosyltransferase involved in cell wall biosynthesis